MTLTHIGHYIRQAGRRCGRPDILFWTLPYLMLLVLIGTLAQKTIGLHGAQTMFFSSFYFIWHGMPFPAGYSVLTLMTINLGCKFVFLSQWSWAKVGIHIIHLSVIILLVGGLLTALTMKEGFVPLKQGQTRDKIMAFAGEVDNRAGMKDLPFSITLNAFHRDVYPGTDMPREYESRVTIKDGGVTWPATISMNEPLRYGGYSFYQASTVVSMDGEPVSVLSVVTNKGWVFPYLSGVLLALGLIYHLVYRLRGQGA